MSASLSFNSLEQPERILISPRSAINQQIALKTIRKLGFVVSAVWNGKEALDYLLAAEGPNPPHSKPDLILMDVQMPIIDGYRATHLIRHHAPYCVSARDIPIVAMTASAIQGDREKCKKAGMDDYLAKPVKSKTLEKMLVRWAIHRRTPRTPSDGDYDGSECDERVEHNCGMGHILMYGEEVEAPTLKTPDPTTAKTPNPRLQPLRPSLSERQNSQRLTLPGTETEGDRAERRKEAEEKAIALRDDKLVEASGVPGEGLVPHGENIRTPGQKLTVENMGKLEQEAKATGRSPGSEFKKRNLSTAGDSMGAEQGTPQRNLSDREKSGERPKLGGKWRDSERTVTGREKE